MWHLEVIIHGLKIKCRHKPSNKKLYIIQMTSELTWIIFFLKKWLKWKMSCRQANTMISSVENDYHTRSRYEIKLHQDQVPVQTTVATFHTICATANYQSMIKYSMKKECVSHQKCNINYHPTIKLSVKAKCVSNKKFYIYQSTIK